MSKWEILRRSPDVVTLLNTNLNTNEVYDCGSMDGQVPDAWVLEWIINHANNLHPGDVIRLSNGKVLHFSRIRGRS